MGEKYDGARLEQTMRRPFFRHDRVRPGDEIPPNTAIDKKMPGDLVKRSSGHYIYNIEEFAGEREVHFTIICQSLNRSDHLSAVSGR